MLVGVLLAALIGTFVGSFLNVCIHRLPRNESIVTPRSRCYSCGTAVAWYDNLPVLSWLVLRGRCRWCGAGFSIRYLLIEALVGLLSGGVIWLAFAPGGGDDGVTAWSAQWLEILGRDGPFMPEPTAITRAAAAASALALVYFLVVSTLTDLNHLIIPDELTKSFQLGAPVLAACTGHNLAIGWTPLPWLFDASGATPGRFLAWFLALTIGALALLALSLPLARRVYTGFVPAEARWEEADHRGFALGVVWFIVACVPATATAALLLLLSHHGWTWALAVGLAQAVLGGLAGWCSLYVVGLLGTMVFRRNAMGFGDVKFLAPIGCVVGPVGVLYVFFVAAVIGSAVGLPLRLLRSRREIPFGPYLAVGALVVLGWGPQLHQFVGRLLWPA